MGRARANAAEWARRVAAWRSSGEPASEFAAREGWNARTLTWWGAQLRRGGVGRAASTAASLIEVVERREAPKPASFVEVVERREAPTTASVLDLIVPRVGTVRISTGTDLVLLRAVVDALGCRE